METNYLTIDEAAAYARVHPQTMRQWLRSGVVKGLKIGTHWRTKAEWIDTAGEQKAPVYRPSQAELEERSAAALERIRMRFGT
jgi:excisionase family DNA binding protein